MINLVFIVISIVLAFAVTIGFALLGAMWLSREKARRDDDPQLIRPGRAPTSVHGKRRWRRDFDFLSVNTSTHTHHESIS